jgi:cytochrome c oxidase assembly factor CtaG
VTLLLDHGDAVPISELRGAWSLEPAVLAGAALALVLFGRAFLRLRRRGRADLAPASRAVLFVAAVAIGTLALVSPLDAAGEEYLLSAHMLQHVLIGDVAVALAVLAVRGPLVFVLLPAAVLRLVARTGPLRTALGWAVRPWVALLVWFVVIAAWHVPASYDAALGSQFVHDLEHASFVVAGLLVWNQLVDPSGRGELSAPRRLALLAAIFWAGQGLANVLLFALSPLYGPYAAQDERLFGLSPLTDQKLAGLVMMGEQVVVLGLCALFLYGLVRREGRLRVTEPAAGRA